MRVLPAFEPTGRDPADDVDPVIVRTDYTDEGAWRAVAAALRSAWDAESGAEARFHLIDDPRWDGATPEELVRAARGVENLSAVFVADAVTLRSSSRPLLALDLCADEDEDLDPAYYQELIDNPCGPGVPHGARRGPHRPAVPGRRERELPGACRHGVPGRRRRSPVALRAGRARGRRGRARSRHRSRPGRHPSNRSDSSAISAPRAFAKLRSSPTTVKPHFSRTRTEPVLSAAARACKGRSETSASSPAAPRSRCPVPSRSDRRRT